MANVSFTSSLPEVTDEMRRKASRVLEAAARDTATRVRKKLLHGTRSGEVYRVPNTNASYRASAPGEAPAPRTGDLANSYTFEVEGHTRSLVGSPLPQARLEFGWGTAAPRPHLRPAQQETIGNIQRIIEVATR